MNILDSALALVAPEFALRRAQARLGLALVRGYDAAATGRRARPVRARGTSADAEVLPALARLRNECRELVRNNAHAGRIVDIWAGNIVGTGITPHFRTGDAALDLRAQELWDRWSEQCDADGVTDFYGLQTLAVRAMVESGESLARRRLRRVGDRLPVPLQLQLLEADRLDSSRDRAVGPRTVGGIEFDALGRRVAYHLFLEHPGAALGTSLRSQQVEAADLAHLYRRDRPEQVRGAPWLARTALRLRELQEWDDATLARAKIEACMALLVTRPTNGASPLGRASTDKDGKRLEEIEPGMISYLQPGEEVTTIAPTGSSSYEPFALHHLMAAAVGAGVTADQMTGDLRQANYSSLRAGKIEQRRLVDQIQWQVVIPQFCAPVMRWFLTAAQVGGALPDETKLPDGVRYRADWVPPRHEPIDPAKDIKADIAAARAGFEPWQEIVARYGYDWRNVIDQAREFAAAMDDGELKFDTDPRAPAPVETPDPAAVAEAAEAKD